MNGYAAKIPARVAGIPCLIGVADYTHHIRRYEDDDWTDYGDWAVLDRNGRPAPWLERKVTGADRKAISQLLDEWFDDDRQRERAIRREERAEMAWEARRERSASAWEIGRTMDSYERSRGL